MSWGTNVLVGQSGGPTAVIKSAWRAEADSIESPRAIE